MHRFLMQVALTQRTVEVEKMNTELKNRIAQLEREALERAEREIQAKRAKECHLELMLKQTLERVTQLESKKNETPKEPEVPKVAEKVPSKHAHAHVEQGKSGGHRPAEPNSGSMSCSSDEEDEDDHITTPNGERVPLTTSLKPQPCDTMCIS